MMCITYVNQLIDDININADVLILAGGNNLYWYNNARYNLIENTLYKEVSRIDLTRNAFIMALTSHINEEIWK